jgi:hypothetical protein
MALTSPGVEVSVIDESFYTPSAASTVPLIIVATAANKPNGAGTGTAQGTLKANAGTPYLITSQRELAETFGNPTFYTDSSNNPLHGNELNEYGLQAAYSFLGVANRTYVVRADADLGELTGSSTAPSGSPADGTYWFDTNDSLYGIFEWSRSTQKFTNKIPLVLNSVTQLVGDSATGDPKTSVGSKGDYAVVTARTSNDVYYKNSDNVWVKVGSTTSSNIAALTSGDATFTSDTWSASWPAIIGTESNPTLGNGQGVDINGTSVTISGTTVSDFANAINGASIDGVGAKVTSTGVLEIYTDGTSKSDGTTDDGAIIINDLAGSTLKTDAGITGTYYTSPAVQISKHSSVPQWKSSDTVTIAGTSRSAIRPAGSVWMKTSTPNLGANVKVQVWNDSLGVWSNAFAPIYGTREEAIKEIDNTGGGKNITAGTIFSLANYTGRSTADDSTTGVEKLVNFKLYRRVTTNPTSVTGIEQGANPTVSAGTFTMAETVTGDSLYATAKTINVGGTTVEDIATAISAAGFTNITATVSNGYLNIAHANGGDIKITDGYGIMTSAGFAGWARSNAGVETGTANFYTAGADNDHTYVISNWKPLVYEASNDAPTSTPADGTLWYNTTLDDVDIMVHDGTKWVGYGNYAPLGNNGSLATMTTDPKGPIVSATAPEKTGGQSDGTDLAEGDIWISTAELDEYGAKVYRWDNTANEWVAVDVTDQTTEDGILFADARYGSTGASGDTAADIDDLLISDYVDPDAPDPDLYPRGMLLWNTRRSGFNVKKFVAGHIDTTAKNTRFNDEVMTNYKANRWIGWNTTKEDGSGLFGRNAQRQSIVAALKSAVNVNELLRDEETRNFTLLSAPGYPELTSDLISLNVDRGLTGFVVADTPFRLTPSATDLQNWGNNTAGASADGEDGAVSYDEYMAMFYPSGLTTDVTGNNIVVPPSHMMLRTIAVSDAVSFPWFAPAGTRRGGISNASSVGYIDSEGEFNAVALNDGVRDTMAGVKINPLTFITGSGLVNFGQYTRARNASSLDRINVARLVAYMRRQMTLLAKPFMFEPNDKITRDEIKQATESLLLELVGQRAIYDFLVVCDETNNTSARIDRNELYVDVAIEPVKSVEFIYIPLRLKNTGEIATLGNQ